jgi:TolB-like protein/Flp pilus assembly protein TadD
MTRHPDSETLERFRLGTLPAQELLSTDEHLGRCDACRRIVGFSGQPGGAVRRWVEALDDDHLSFDEMSRYVDGLADEDDRPVMTMHLEDCAMCRGEVADLSVEAAKMRAATLAPGDAARRWREALGDEDPAARAHRRKTVRYLWGGLAVAATLTIVIGLAVMRSSRLPAPVPPIQVASASIRSMAILPLRNVAERADDDFLSVGIADALVTRLEQDPSLDMRPMSSLLRIQRESADLRTAMEKLKVDVVLEGQFFAVKDLVRVTLQLTEARSGHALWSESIEGPRGDLLRLVDLLTERTESRLNERPRVANAPKYSEPRSASPEAYESYLKARSLSGTLVQARYASEVAALRKAVELDPKFAAAHADLAIALELGGLVRGLDAAGDTLNEAERHAREAVRIDPRLPEAHLALGRVLSTRPDRFPEAMREIVAAIELKPTDTHALQIVTSYFAALGDLERARCVSDRLVSIDPLSAEAKMRGYWYIAAVEPAEALRQADNALDDPDNALAGHDIRGLAFILQGDLGEADREAEAALRLSPNHYIGESLKAMVAAGRGHRQEAESWLAKFREDANRNHFSAVRVAMCRAKLGDRDAAVEWIERAAKLGDQHWNLLNSHPWLASLHAEPRFQQCLARIKGNLDAAHADVMRVYPSICRPRDGDGPGKGSVDVASGKDFGRSAGGNHATLIEDDRRLGDLRQFGGIVRDVEHRQAKVIADAREKRQNPPVQGTVEAGQRLIEKQQAR